jgi:hypothetical protein
MKENEVKIGKRYLSKKNPLSEKGGSEYEVVKKNKTTCWVRLWSNGVRKNTIYKNVEYRILTEIL